MAQVATVKIVLLGTSAVGKTSIMSRAISDSFSPEEKSTVGAQFSTKVVQNSQNVAVTFRIWDTAGQEKFRSLAPMYFHGSHFALVVFSLTDPATLDDARTWVEELKVRSGDRIPEIYLLGNKADLKEGRNVSVDKAQAFAEEIGAVYFETSALSGQNIPEVFADIADRANPKEEAPAGQDLTPSQPDAQSPKSCC
jgi:small GTP-binding protein